MNNNTDHEEIIGKPLEDYVKLGKNQDECSGFIDGYNVAKAKCAKLNFIVSIIIGILSIVMYELLNSI